MLIVRKFEFEMAHCLDGHNRGCNNVHGHSYKLEVGYKPSELIELGSSAGMGIDFGDVKRIVNEAIIENLDHGFIYNENNKTECKIAKQLKKLGKKVIKFHGRTTCENMAKWFLMNLIVVDDCFEYVRLYETSGSYVIIGKEDIYGI